MSAPLTWNDLANAYDKANPHGRRARTMGMDVVWAWAIEQPYFKLQGDGSLRRVDA